MTMTLDESMVPGYLRERGLSRAEDAAWTVMRLTGGVSGSVFSASDGSDRFVVKQSLEKLAVEEDWLAPRERILTEAKVIDIISGIGPDFSPRTMDVDPQTLTLTMEHAPPGWTDWKSELLASHVDVDIAGSLGDALGRIHAATRSGEWSLPPDDGIAGFTALRIEPFHVAAAARMPEHSERILAVAARTLARRTCLVHGDFSPKNILVSPKVVNGDRAFWIIDDEVGHRGDPVFDVAFLLSHLALKRIRADDTAVEERLDAAAAAFLDRYADAMPGIDPAALSEQIGCLVLARVHGRSPVRYLDEQQRALAVRLGAILLHEPARFDPRRPLTAATTRSVQE